MWLIRTISQCQTIPLCYLSLHNCLKKEHSRPYVWKIPSSFLIISCSTVKFHFGKRLWWKLWTLAAIWTGDCGLDGLMGWRSDSSVFPGTQLHAHNRLGHWPGMETKGIDDPSFRKTHFCHCNYLNGFPVTVAISGETEHLSCILHAVEFYSPFPPTMFWLIENMPCSQDMSLQFCPTLKH